MRLANPSIESKPRSDTELVFPVNCGLAARGMVSLQEWGVWRALALSLRAVVADQAESLCILLREPEQPCSQVAALFDPRDGSLAPLVFGGTVLRRRSWEVLRGTLIVRRIVVIERRDGQQEARAQSTDPREKSERIAFAVRIMEELSRCSRIMGIKRNLVEVATRLSDDAELVVGICVVDERGESAEAVARVMIHSGTRRLQAKIAAVAVHAGVVRKFVGVPAEIELIVGLIETPRAEYQLRFIVALEAGARSNIEDAVGAVAVVGSVAAALDFECVNVFGVDLRSKIAGDVRVRYGHPINQPTRLVAAANVQLVVREIGARNKVRDHGEAVGSRGSRGLLNLEAIDKTRRRDRLGLACVSRNGDGLVLRRKLEFQMENWRRAGEYG